MPSFLTLAVFVFVFSSSAAFQTTSVGCGRLQRGPLPTNRRSVRTATSSRDPGDGQPADPTRRRRQDAGRKRRKRSSSEPATQVQRFVPTDSVVARLSRAAKAAHAQRRLAERQQRQRSRNSDGCPSSDEPARAPPLSSISALTRAIDNELMSATSLEQHRGTLHLYSRRKTGAPQSHSSVMGLLEHNQRLDRRVTGQNNDSSRTGSHHNPPANKRDPIATDFLASEYTALRTIDPAANATQPGRPAHPVKDAALAAAGLNSTGGTHNATASDDRNSSNVSAVDPRLNQLRACHVAVVFSKPLVQDQITVEYASRLMMLARAMALGGYRPKLVCLLTNPVPSPETNHLTDAAVGYTYFRHLCSCYNVDLSQTRISMVPTAHSSIDGIGSLHPVVQAIEHSGSLKKWLAESDDYERSVDEYGLKQDAPRKKVHIHFALFSSDYHLCNLNDIYQRSPRQSVLNTLQSMANPSSSPSIRQRGVIETSWSFQYSTYPYIYAQEDLTVFLGKCYVMAQQLRPLLVNLRGVRNNVEFFQKDNYQQLVNVRRSLVTQIEELNNYYYNQNSNAHLVDDDGDDSTAQSKIQLKQKMSKVPTMYGATLDVALEGALLSLGRCLDVLRPAGGTGSRMVRPEAFIQAATLLEHFLEQIQGCCDPDRPLQGRDWGKLSMDTVTIPSFMDTDNNDSRNDTI